MAAIEHHNATERPSRENMAATVQCTPGFPAAFDEAVTSRFHRLTALDLVTSQMDCAGTASMVAAPAFPQHPLCRGSGCTGRCAAAWRSLLAELALRPEVRRHECEVGMFCASVPFLWHHCCFAVGRLVCPAAMGRESFEHGIELLGVLWENFTSRYTDAWSGAAAGAESGHQADDGNRGATGDHERRLVHAKVRKAMEYIDEHFADPTISADGIADLLNVNPTYLAHLFAEQVGVRMSRYIADRRIGLAKRLLAGTTWQIKRVAKRAGYRDPDWFSHVFHAHTGMKAGEYRRRIRETEAGEPQ
jgi:AraC-like DNA-binding protein